MMALAERISHACHLAVARAFEVVRRHPIWVAIGGLIAMFLYASPALGKLFGLHASSSVVAAAQEDSFFSNLFKVYMPRRLCMYQETSLIWLHVVSDAVIAISYYSIPIALIYFV